MTTWPLQTIAVANQKGGVGKTTTATNLACGLAHRGFRTCLIDNDAQRNASATLGVDTHALPDDGSGTVIEIYADATPASKLAIPVEGRFGGRLSVIPAHSTISGFDMQVETTVLQQAARGASFEDQQDMRQEMVDRLRESLKSLDGEFDAVVVDTPPSLGFMLTAALRAADWLLVPVTCSDFCKNGVRDLMSTVNKITARGNPRLKLFRAVLGMYDARKVLHQQDADFYKAQFGDGLHSTYISQSVRVEELAAHRLSIFEHAPDSEQARQFLDLTDAFIEDVEGLLTTARERQAKREADAASQSGPGIVVPAPPLTARESVQELEDGPTERAVGEV
ncbi:MAG: ParA family protein [Cyanobacteria bacterium J06648_11]